MKEKLINFIRTASESKDLTTSCESEALTNKSGEEQYADEFMDPTSPFLEYFNFEQIGHAW
jgi:hypothetical protein